MKQKISALVLSQREIAPGVYDMWIGTSLAKEAAPGQFVGIYPKDKSTLLPRPISICEVRGDGAAIRIVYRVAGAGTEEFSHYGAGETISLLGVLGNGFPLEEARGNVVLIGGGIGVPPMLELLKRASGQNTATACGATAAQNISVAQNASVVQDIFVVLGYRDEKAFLREDFEKYGKVYIATEDGSVGVKGNVLDAIRENGLKADVIFACGPKPMLRAVKAYAEEKGISAYISLEEHMACGVGACLGCVVKTRRVDPHSHVHNARICTEGPVFEAGDVEI